ncbi:MAG: hypothetical protein IJH05_03510 [Firmicutes bacterium]|nr:hypothetical protein [Bacillota bacterium]
MAITGITVTLYVKTQAGVDALNHPVYSETPVQVEDVLVAPASSDDLIDSTMLEGKKAVYTLAIPKGDTHDWLDVKVELPEPFAGVYKTFGFPTAGIEANIPLRWNKKVMVERYG